MYYCMCKIISQRPQINCKQDFRTQISLNLEDHLDTIIKTVFLGVEVENYVDKLFHW